MSKNCNYKHKIPLDCNILIGQPGPKGKADTISIGKTIVAEPYEEAKVIDNYNNNNHTLDFIIPRGKDGNSINILGSYNSVDDLIKEHNTGNIGDAYLVDGNLYIWADNTKSWQNIGEIKGPQGEQGPPGMKLMQSSYIVTFNNSLTSDGIAVKTQERIPLTRAEININNLITLDNNIITLNEAGYYKVTFTISAYPEVTKLDFDPDNDFVSIGFKELDSDNIYIGTSGWVYNGEAALLTGQGIISVPTNNKSYELINISKNTIYLNSPDIRNIASASYFSNCLVTIIIDYLGNGL